MYNKLENENGGQNIGVDKSVENPDKTVVAILTLKASKKLQVEIIKELDVDDPEDALEIIKESVMKNENK